MEIWLLLLLLMKTIVKDFLMWIKSEERRITDWSTMAIKRLEWRIADSGQSYYRAILDIKTNGVSFITSSRDLDEKNFPRRREKQFYQDGKVW